MWLWVTNSYSQARLCGSLQANYSAAELKVLGSDPFASGEALNGGGTPILCDTGSGLDFKLAAYQDQAAKENYSHDQKVGEKRYSHRDFLQNKLFWEIMAERDQTICVPRHMRVKNLHAEKMNFV